MLSWEYSDAGLSASKFLFPWVREDEVASHVFDLICDEATEKVEEHQDAIAELEDELSEELEEIWERWKDVAGEIDDVQVALERNDVALDELTLFWAPVS